MSPATSSRRLAPVRRAAVAVFFALVAAAPRSVAQRPPRGEHRAFAVFREWHPWIRPEEWRVLGAIDTRRTARGDDRRLALAAADSALRVIAPLALDAASRPAEAGELRALPPITDPASAQAAIGHARQIAARLRQSRRIEPQEAALGLAIEAAEHALLPRPLTYGSLAARSAWDAGEVAHRAIELGATRVAVIDAVAAMFRSMAAAATQR
jgi:hypothetical protein